MALLTAPREVGSTGFNISAFSRSLKRVHTKEWLYSLSGVGTFIERTSSSCTEWTGMCCSNGFSSQNKSFNGIVFNYKMKRD